MKAIITLIFILLVYTNWLKSQTATDSILLNIELNYFNTNSNFQKNNYALKKLELLIASNRFNQPTIFEIERINDDLILDSVIKTNFLWNASLIYYLNKQLPQAINYFQKYEAYKGALQVNEQLFSALVYLNYDTIYANNKIAELDSIIPEIKNLQCFHQLNNYNKKHKNAYLTASAILPGSGTMALGKVTKGVTSLALNTASTLAIISLFNNGLYFNSLTWGLTLLQKFYIGNIKLTSKTFNAVNNNELNQQTTICQTAITTLLAKHHIGFK